MTDSNKSLWLGWAVFLASTATVAFLGLLETHGRFNYALDDAYIHLAVAKTLAFHGTWGLRPGEFCSASSSPLWTVTLAGIMKIFGQNVYIPLIINVLCGLVLTWLYLRVGKFLPKTAYKNPFLLALLIISPLAHLVLIGMEHLMQAVLFLTFFGLAIGWFRPKKYKIFTCLLVLSPLVSTVRFEGLFLVAGCCGLFFLEKKWREAMLIGLVAALPVAIFGFWSMKQGGYFLPNSLMVKTDASSLASPLVFIKNLLVRSLNISPLFWTVILFNAAIFCFLKPTNELENSLRKGGLVLFLTAVLTAFFAKNGFMYRLEAALVTMAWGHGLLYFFHVFGKISGERARAQLVLFILVIGFPFFVRAGFALRGTELGMKNVREHHFAMTDFLGKYYPDRPVAINDIGVLAYFSNVHFVDLMGLGSTDFIESGGATDLGKLAVFCRKKGVAVAPLYLDWTSTTMPVGWQKVGLWPISKAVICADKLVFFAVDPSESELLRSHLIEFSAMHPETKLLLEPVK